MKVIFCLPGKSFSGNFLQCWTTLLEYCNKNNIQYLLSQKYSCNIYYVRNMCLGADVMRGKNQKPFDGKLNYTHIMWLDSDMIFNPQQFQRLLDSKKDVIAGIYKTENGRDYACGDWSWNFFKSNGYMPFHTDETLKNKSGLVEVAYSGMGFMLVRKGVFESLEYPWFSAMDFDTEKNGVQIQDFCMEDVAFCLKAKKAGYKIWIDPSVKLGHEKSIIL